MKILKTSIRTIILAAAAVFAAMSCQKEVAGKQELVKEGETIQVNINAGLGGFVAADGTKATATPVVRLTWEDADEVDAYYGTQKLNTNPITVTPSENRMFAKLSGEISSTGLTSGTSVITFVYSNVNNIAATNEAPAFDFSSQDGTIPFVAYATLVYDGATTLTDKMVEFKFATSVMKIAATNLGGDDITNATIDGINTKVTLTPQTNSETVNISGNTSGTIAKTTGFDASSDGTRAIFTVGLVPDNNTGRSITVQQTNINKGAITSNEIKSSKSYTTLASLFSCGKIGDHDYVLIAGTKWATQNLAITDSGKKAWKGDNTGDNPEVKVPGTNEDVIVGDYFQWAAYAGYCGNASGADKGLLIYNSFINTKCFEVTGTDVFDLKSAGGSNIYRFSAYDYGSYKAISPYCESSAYKNYQSEGAGLADKDDVARILWQSTWRMPTTSEFKAMREATYWAWDATDCGYYVFMPGLGTSGVAGGRADITSSDDKSKALLFFPLAGRGYDSESNPGELNGVGTYGIYWSSTLRTSTNAYDLYLTNSSVDPQDSSYRSRGFSVRPVSD